MDGIEELVVHSAVDDVDRAVAMGRAHPYLSTGAHQVAALDELDAHHPGEQRMFVVGGVEDARCQDDDGRVSGPVGRRGTQAVKQHLRVVADRADAHRVEGLGKDVGHRPSVGDDIADARGHPHVVLEHAKGAGLVADEVHPGDVDAHAVGGADPHDGPVVVLRRGDQPPGHDPFVDSPGDLTLSRVDVVEEHLEGRDPLHDAGLDDIPLVGGDDSWDGVERKRSLLARMVKGHPLVEVSPGQGVCALLE